MIDYQERKRKKIEIIVGYFFTAGIIILIIFSMLIFFRTKWNFMRNTYLTYYDYGNDIKPGTVVTLNGLVVGEVKEVDIDENNRIEVYMSIRRKYREKIKKDSVAKIVRPLLIGNKQINILPGSNVADVLPPGSTIKSEDSSELVDLISGMSLQNFIDDNFFKTLAGDLTGDGELQTMSVREIYDNAIATLVAMNEFQKSINSMSMSLNQFAFMINNMSKGLDNMGDALHKMDNLTAPMEGMSGGLENMSAGFTDMSQGLKGMSSGMYNLSKSFEAMDENMDGFTPLTEKTVKVLDELDILIRAMQHSVLFKKEVEKIINEDTKGSDNKKKKWK